MSGRIDLMIRDLDRRGEALEIIRRRLKTDPRLSPEDRELVDALGVRSAALKFNRAKMATAVAANDVPAMARCLKEVAGE